MIMTPKKQPANSFLTKTSTQKYTYIFHVVTDGHPVLVNAAVRPRDQWRDGIGPATGQRGARQLISSYLYKSTKVILKACVNLRIYKIDSYNDIVKKQAEILIKSAEELRTIISMLKNGAPLKDVTACNYRIKDIENRGDEILFTATEEIFSGKYDALYVLKLRDIYKGIENALDICSVISDLIVNIALKHS